MTSAATSTDLIQFDPAGSFIDPGGISPQRLQSLAPRLEALRDEIFEVDLPAFGKQQPVPPEKQPLDTAFVDLPDRLLMEFEHERSSSELAAILATAKRIRETVDRVVVIGIGGSYMGARAMMDACCEPFYNQLSRADRGGRPRLYFEGNNIDNDATQGLLHLLRQTNDGDQFGGKWAIVVISKSGGTIEAAVAFRQFLRELESQLGSAALPDLVVPITGAAGKLASLADAIGCRDRFLVPEGVGGRFSVFSAVGLLPASILGIDIVSLLRGGWLMNGHFQSTAARENLVLKYAGVNHLMEQHQDITMRLLSVWSKSLESVGLWYDQLLAESIGKKQMGVTPLTVVNTRDLHSRAQQHQQGVRNKLITNLVVNQWRSDPLAVGYSDRNQDQLNDLAEKSLPELMNAAIRGTNEAYLSDSRPTTCITLPQVNEHALGQLLQMFMLATVIECRLIGVNPYGQPGVEMYKNNMNRILRNSASGG